MKGEQRNRKLKGYNGSQGLHDLHPSSFPFPYPYSDTHIHDRNTQTKGRKEVLNSNYPLKEQKAKKVRIK